MNDKRIPISNPLAVGSLSVVPTQICNSQATSNSATQHKVCWSKWAEKMRKMEKIHELKWVFSYRKLFSTENKFLVMLSIVNPNLIKPFDFKSCLVNSTWNRVTMFLQSCWNLSVTPVESIKSSLINTWRKI